MEVIIIVNGIGKRYEVEKPKKCSDRDFEDFLFSELEQSDIKQGNKMIGFNLGKLDYICHLKCEQHEKES